ncbi:p protein [Lasius niger]|uniref:P protein n=1 Tax=Lasius niger TaxID=67767 RepID=A0A0J7K2P3_LASNI|nr:p protein [Lasius niger]
MSQNDTSDDETGLQTPQVSFLKASSGQVSHCSCNNSVIIFGYNFVIEYPLKVMRSPISPSSSVSSSMIFGQISDDVLRAWSQLPEAIRLDPRLAIFQRECDRIAEARSVDCAKRDCLVVNMCPHLVTQTSVQNQVQAIQSNADEDGQDVHTQEKQKPFCRYSKLIALSCCWLLFTITLMFKSERIETMHRFSIPNGQTKNYQVGEDITSTLISVTVEGSLLPSDKIEQHANLCTHHLMIWLELLTYEDTPRVNLEDLNVCMHH